MKKIATILAIFLVILFVSGYFAVYLPFTKIKAKAEIVNAKGKELKTVFKKNNIDLVNSAYAEFSKSYVDLENEAKAVYWLSFIPYIKDFKNGIEAGDYIIDAGKQGLIAITPYADLIGFKKGQTSFVEKSAEDRLQTAVATLDKVLGKIDVVSDDIKKAQQKIDQIDPNRYPEKIGKYEVKSTIINLKTQFEGMASLFVDAKPLVKNIPTILGKDKVKTYLILFQNDKELRATGGFLTSYAVFRVNEGKISIQKSEDIYTLDNSISIHPTAPEEILNYHKGVTKFYIRDSNLSPDLVKSIGLFNSLYERSGERVDYDGIILLDSKVLVDMLSIFGDTEADGVVFSAKNDKRCDCAQVIYTLFDLVDRPVGYVKENRKGIMGDLMYQLFYKAIGFSPSKYWGTLAQTMFKNLEDKDILLYFKDAEIQKSVEKLNFAGRIKDYDGDYLHINNVNFAGAKSNLYVKEAVTSKTDMSSSNIKRDVKIEFRNPYPASDCNLERGGLCLNATLRNWIRFYVPKGSTLIKFTGSATKVKTYDDLGKTVFEGFMTVDPQGKAEVEVSYSLPANISKNNYKLLIQKQPGIEDQKYLVQFDGKKIFDGEIIKDIEVK